MEQEEFKNLIVERFNNLQPEIQAIIVDPNYIKELIALAEKYKLTPEQAGFLELHTTLVLIENTHPDEEYNSELAEDLKLAPEIITKIISDVNENILKNVIGMIRQNFIEDDKNEKASSNSKFVSMPFVIKEMEIALKEGVGMEYGRSKSDFLTDLSSVVTSSLSNIKNHKID